MSKISIKVPLLVQREDDVGVHRCIISSHDGMMPFFITQCGYSMMGFAQVIVDITELQRPESGWCQECVRSLLNMEAT